MPPCNLFQDKRTVLEIIAAQDGTVETEFKSRLCRAFEIFGTVERAYLALVKHDLPPTPAPNGAVALCLAFRPGVASGRTVAHCLAVFKEMFSAQNFLDVIPLDESMEATLRTACVPFYQSEIAN